MIYANISKIRYKHVLYCFHGRLLSNKSTSKISYKDSLNLPKTKFPLSMKDGIVLKRELKIQKVNFGYTSYFS